MSALDPSDLGEDAQQGLVSDEMFEQVQGHVGVIDSLELLGNNSVSMVSQDAFENNRLAAKAVTEKSEPNMTLDNVSAFNSEVNSPRETVSPTASSPFSAMESDGEGVETGQDDANLSCAGDQSFNQTNGYYGASTPLNTTTPCASSSCCDDDYDTVGSRKKRRKTRRDMHSFHPGITMVQVMKQPNAGWPQDNDTSPFSPPTCPKTLNFQFSSNTRRPSSGTVANPQGGGDDDEFPSGNAKRTRKCTEPADEEMAYANIKTETPSNIDTAVGLTVRTTPVSKRGANPSSQSAAATEDEQLLHRQYPRKSGSYELHIITQPEPQHRARYLTEGSRGPVKDATQTGFPKVQLLGYTKPVILQVFVATDSGKIKPHGFYQACRVTGRNTSACEEIEIQGTKVIEIPFKQEDGSMILNIDCVGILKLRNTDVEVRTGLRNQKRNQSVRLVFRVTLKAFSNNGLPVVLQVASGRISCTQPLGQPEITKKSIDRCSVEGGTEMFIIGKNFHRGTKVIYQDPEEPDGKQWCAEGEIEKDTFHQYHMVVRVPPYHDQNIVKPVNVQLIVEFQDKKCEPHSFTYTQKPKDPEPVKEEVKQPAQAVPVAAGANIESAFHLLDGPVDKKLLLALFSRLLNENVNGHSENASGCNTPDRGDTISIPPTINAQTCINAVLKNQANNTPIQQNMKDSLPAVNPNPVSPPSTLFAAISVQNPQPVFAQPVTNMASIPPQTFQTFVATNVGGVPSTVVNKNASVDLVRLIKSESVVPETHASFGTATAVPSIPVCAGQMSVGGSHSVPAVATHNVSSPTMVVSPPLGQPFQHGMQQATQYSSFVSSHAATGATINSVPVLAASTAQPNMVSQVNGAQMESSVNNQLAQPPNSMSTASVVSNNNAQPTLPVANFQVTQVQQGQQFVLSTGSVPDMLVAQSVPAVAHVEQAHFSQSSMQNSSCVSQTGTNVLQRPTFTFQNTFENAITTTAVPNLQVTTASTSKGQMVGAGQIVYGDLHFTVGAGDQNVQHQSMAVDQPVVVAKPQGDQPFTIITDSVHPSATFTLNSKADTNQSTHSFASSVSNVNQPFIVAGQNHPVFHQQTRFDPQSLLSTTVPSVHQGTTAYHGQYAQLQTGKALVSNQSLGAVSQSEEKQMQIDSFPGSQNTMDAMTVRTASQIAVQPMEDVLTQNFNNGQGSAVVIQQDHQMAEVVSPGNQQQPHIQAIIIQHQPAPVPMAAEPSPSSASDNSPQAVADNSQQMSTGFVKNHQNYQVELSTDTSMLHESTVNQPMELSHSNMAAQGTPNFQLQQQQPTQNAALTATHDLSMAAQNFQVEPAVNIHGTNDFQNLQQQVAQNQSLQATNVVGGNGSNVAISGFNSSLQQTIRSNEIASGFQGTSVASENFNPQNFPSLQQKSAPVPNQGQTFEANAVLNVHGVGSVEGFQQSLQQQHPSNNAVAAGNGTGTTVESHIFQGLQQPQTVSMSVTQNFQGNTMNFVNAAVLDQQNLQTVQLNTNTSQSVMNAENFQHLNVNIAVARTESVTVPVTFQNMPSQNSSVSISGQQYQAPSQSTQSSQAAIASVDSQNQDFASHSSKQHVMNSHPQINATYSFEGEHGITLPHGNLQNPALHHHVGQQLQHPCASNTVNSAALEPHSPDIYAMTHLLRTIDGSENLAAISGEDIQRHCQ